MIRREAREGALPTQAEPSLDRRGPLRGACRSVEDTASTDTARRRKPIRRDDVSGLNRKMSVPMVRQGKRASATARG